ncbi:DUF2202 domain-containing protein [Phycicoccus sp. MAQZ13P-2]|uniref:ferritin-like domain-containing protein n=1 Tax=Phycicoccus mangrovi TaxID=2840470 RepID=UPI001C0020BD|nr:DUF2202 domain-containing protein [Phycicoccus mangrovi]MBT9256947.1 DUF2202 domain-containing protein [Phycicoccus mangrovi]MBT9274904.1 DUF2202 domain-containing protein [Phycicoccus mangrovi]
MGRTRTATLAAIGAGALLAVGLAAGQSSAATPTAGTATATPALTDALRFASDEERMARDLYAAIADRYDGALPFSRITTSEQRHLDAVSGLLDRYGVTDPADGSAAGHYADPAVQQLYDTWWAKARRSLDDAYDVGVALEQRDIADLEKTIAADLPSDVDAVLGRLVRGSQMHLRAFTAAADGQTVTGTMSGPGSSDGMAGRGRGGMMSGRGGRGAGGGAGNSRTTDCPMLDAG